MVRFNKQMVCLFVLSLFALGSAQRETSPERLWHSDTALFDAAYSVAYDPAGNVIVAGFFQGELAGVSAQGRDAFVASLTNEGEVNWLSHLGGAGDDKALNVTTDDDGNVFVVGYVSGEATLGEVTLGEVTLGDSELASTFVAKFASDGSLQWAQSLASTGVTYGYGVAADGAGGVFVAGFFSGDINLVDAVTAQGSSDIFALHLDAEGNPQWFTALGGDAGDVAYDVARDSAGNLYLAGRFRDTVDFVTLDGDVTLTALGDRDALLISLTEAGEVRWAQSWGGDGADVVWSVATFDNRVYTAGYFSGYANLDPEADPDLRLRAGGTLDSFVAAFDDSGQFQWGRQRSSSGLASAHDLTVDRLGVIYEVGRASDSLPGAGVGPLRGYLSQYNEDGDRINDLMLDVSSVQGVAVSDALTAYLAAYGEIAGVTDTSEDAMTVSASAEAQVWQLVQVAPEVDEPTLDVTDDVTDTSEDVTSEDVASEDVATDEAPTEETSADETVTDEASADETTTDDAVSDETSVEDISNEGVPIDEVTVEDVAPEPVEDPSTEDAEPELEDVPAEDVSAEDVVPEDAPSEDDLTDEADVDAVADETETSSEGTSSENAPEPASSTDSSTTDSVTDDVQSTPESGSSDTETSPSDSN